MKKFTTIFFVMISALLLSSCGGDNPPSLEDRAAESQDIAQSVISYTGTIEALGVDIYQDGTHKIMTDDDQAVVIQSPVINLNNFIGKKVMVTGSMQKLIDNKTEVFTVSKIELASGSDVSVTDYSSLKFGFKFSYPVKWEINEDGGGITFQSNGADVAKIDVLNNIDSSLDDYVKSKEIEDGTPVTISAQRSLRFTDGGEIRIYVPNETKKKIYKIIFLGGDSYDTSANKNLFYSFLETFSLTSAKVSQGDKCGGKDNIACQDGFICELESTSDDAEGVCVSVDTDSANPDCPYVPVPTGCTDYQAKSFNKNNCPTSYTCLDKPSENTAPTPSQDSPAETGNKESSSGTGVSAETGSSDTSVSAGDSYSGIISAFEKNKEAILPGAQIQRYEVVEGQSLLSIIFTSGDSKFKNVYGYKKSGGSYDFTKIAAYTAGEERDWVLSDGEDVRITSDKIVVDAEGGNTSPQTVFKDMRLYENSSKNFSLQYPSNWYYRNFGAVDDTIFTVGFGPNALDALSDASIKLSILKDSGVDRRALSGDSYTAEVKRDEISHFYIRGPIEMKETVDKMADTITNFQ